MEDWTNHGHVTGTGTTLVPCLETGKEMTGKPPIGMRDRWRNTYRKDLVRVTCKIFLELKPVRVS